MFFRSVVMGVVMLCIFFGIFNSTLVSVRAAQKTVNIQHNAFDKETLILIVGDVIKFDNEDSVPHTVVIKRVVDDSVLKRIFLNPAGKSVSSSRKTFSHVGDYIVFLDGHLSRMSVSVVSASATATPSPLITPLLSPSLFPTVEPTVTSSPILSPVASPSLEPSDTPLPSPTDFSLSSPSATVAPTAGTSLVPTFEPIFTLSPSVSFSPSPSVDVHASLTPVPTASVMPSPTSPPSVVVSESPYPYISPSLTPSPRGTSSPTVLPTMPPAPAVLPSFSVFRRTSCSSQFLSDDKFILTDKLSSLYLTQGYWLVSSLRHEGSYFTVEASLHQVRTINLFFRGNPFFGGVIVSSGVGSVSFSASSRSDVLQRISSYWCSR